MGRRQVIISDLSGKEVDEADSAQLVFRRGPDLDRPVVVDVIADEVADIVESPDVYTVEVKPYNGPTRELVVNRKELEKLVADGDLNALLGQSARPTRGRPPVTRR